MAIRGVSRKAVPYIPERERGVTEQQSVIWIRQKDGHAANKTLALYAGAGRDGRGGYREIAVGKLDTADVTQFVEIVEKIENYVFSEAFPDLASRGVIDVIDDEATIAKVAQDIDPELMTEIFEVSNDAAKLALGSKKG